MKNRKESLQHTSNVLQVRFICVIPIDLFHNLLHTPGSTYTYVLKQLWSSLNEIDSIEMIQVACLQLPKGFISIFIPLVVLCKMKVRSVVFDRCEITVMHFKFIPCDTNE